MPLVERVLIGSLLITMTIGIVRECSQQAKAQDGHAQMHPTYQQWKTPGGHSCCDDRDCRPTRAYVDEQGRWRALADGGWVVVPPETVLKLPSPDGRSHICMTPGAMEPRCFVPGEPRI